MTKMVSDCCNASTIWFTPIDKVEEYLNRTKPQSISTTDIGMDRTLICCKCQQEIEDDK